MAITTSWNTATNGNWDGNSPSYWSNGVPNAADTTADIALAGTYTVTIGGGETFTVGTLNLTDARATVQDNGDLVVDTAAAITGIFNDNGTLDLSAGATATVTGKLILLLTNDTTIAQLDDVDAVTYWHVELDSHDVILANGLPAESYIDVGNRCEFEGEATLTLHPLFKSEPLAGYCRPFVTGGAMLAAIRAQLAEVAGAAPGETAAPGFHLLVAGEQIDPVVCGHQAAFVVPPGERDVRLVSPTWSPREIDPTSSDDRRLGLMIEALTVDDLVGGITEVPLQSRALVAGFHPLEGGPLGAWRWTGGDALLSASLFAGRTGPCVLRLTGQFTPPTATPRAEALAA